MKLKRRFIRLFVQGLLAFIRWGILHNLWPKREQQMQLTGIILGFRNLHEANA